MRIVKDNGYEHKNLTVQEFLADYPKGGNVTITLYENVSGKRTEDHTIVTDTNSLHDILGLLIRSAKMTNHDPDRIWFTQDGSGIFRDIVIYFTVS